ncbi:MAG: bifunctional folylpolyglutamate synthase/dihydrofolate synthase [Ruminococcus sp.]|nr:bifunctional folylpolyglutamate synthase/dihydrofolate synthase [Ruminococcus sp.]
MTYDEAVDYILKIPKFTKKNPLEHTKEFLRFLGNPERDLKVIHVAGTNGKGSVCVYLDAMLRSEGKSAGLFVSPHLIRMNERIRIRGEQISDREFVRVFEKVMEKVREMEHQGLSHPTFFELLFGMAMTAFAEAGVEFAVLETGLGGRLDATNAVEHPAVTAIASIGMDHQEILGDTLEQIAAEKAGILKKGVPVFYSEGEEAAGQVIESQAARLGISCKKIGKNAFENLRIEHKNIAFSCTNAYYGTTAWKLRNTGLYQAENAMLALEVMKSLFGETGRPRLWREALAQVVWEGRMEEVLPGIYIDGAHNLNAVVRFVQSVKARGPHRTAVLFSAVQEKDYEEMTAYLCRNLETDYYVVTRIEDSRAADTEKLLAAFARYTDRSVAVIESPREALHYVRKHQDGRTVYCLGSLYLAGMLKELAQEESLC